MISRHNTWTYINLVLSIEVKDTNWFLDKNRTDQRARNWSPKVIPRFMTDRTAKKPMQCLRWKCAFEGLEQSVLADILGKWHQDFSRLVCWMISAYRVQMYTQHKAFVRKARQASCNLRKKITHMGTFNSHTCFVKPRGLILFSVLRVQQTSTIWDRESRQLASATNTNRNGEPKCEKLLQY